MGVFMDNEERKSILESDNPDYTNIVIDDMVNILTGGEDEAHWSGHYTNQDKINFLDKLINYLTKNQSFEMCSKIQEVKERIKNESVTKNKKT